VLVGKTMYCVAQDATKKPHITINKYLYNLIEISMYSMSLKNSRLFEKIVSNS
jgi:hypothetical protein